MPLGLSKKLPRHGIAAAATIELILIQFLKKR
jgi:hypothetical protein